MKVVIKSPAGETIVTEINGSGMLSEHVTIGPGQHTIAIVEKEDMKNANVNGAFNRVFPGLDCDKLFSDPEGNR